MTVTSVSETEIVRLASKLIELQAHDCSRHRQDFGKLRKALTRWCRKAGLTCSVFPTDPPAVVIEFGDPAAGREIWLLAHADTVPFQSDDQCVPKVEGNWLRARGAADDLGPLAVALLAARTLKRVRGIGGRVVISFDEETLPASAWPRHSIDQVVASHSGPIAFGLALEATDLRLSVASLGASVLKLTVSGRAGHSARPETGVNAIRWLSRLLLAADGIPSLRVASEMFPQRSSLEPIWGMGGDGVADNVIPAKAEARFNLRHLPDVPLELITAELGAAFHQEIERWRAPGSGSGLWTPRGDAGGAPDFALVLEGGFPPVRVSHDHPLVVTLAAILRKWRSGDVLFGQQGTGDIALLGAPGGELGPDAKDLHGPNERVEISSLHALLAIIVEFFEVVGANAS